MARSKLEDALDAAILELYGAHDPFVSDMPIKVRGTTLYVDRVNKSKKIAIEVDGRQHDEFVAHFHGDKQGFQDSKKRDALKVQWLEANGYTVVRFKHNEKITAKALRDKLIKALSGT